ncbi:MAG: chaperonin GroEL [Patescibacteria group bacterium]
MAKQILYKEKARNALFRGVDIVANAVKITLGPRGRNAVLDKGYGTPTITNDGVSIAREITLKDKFENMGAEIVKEVASKTNDNAGDGTTTAIIITQAIIEEGVRQTAMGVNAMGIRLGIEAGAKAVVEELKKMAKPIKSHEEIVQVANIAAESSEVGKIIADTIKKVGKDGVVTVEESQSFGVEAEFVEGLQFDKGYLSPYMITDGERMEAEYKDTSILITDKKISSVKEILPLLEKIAATGRKELVIIAEDVDGEALTTFVLNMLRGAFKVLAIKAPGYGDRKKELLQDIAITVGGTVVSDETGMTLEKADLGTLGHSQKVIASKDDTIIVGGKGKKSDIEARINQLKTQKKNSDSKFDTEKLDERIAKLSGGVAIIKVGAATESEMKYLKLKIEDAVNATKAAIDEGIVAGGGVALIKAAEKVASKNLKSPNGNFAKEFEVGVNLVLSALSIPLKQIAINAGKDDGAVIVEKVKEGKGNYGYDALAGTFVADMIVAGIVDPVKVTRLGVENAASAAAILLTTEVAITDEPKEEKEVGGGAPGMGGY